MIEKFLNIFKIPDLRKKLIFTGLLLLVYRIGGKVPIPGIDKTALASMMQGYANSLLGLYDIVCRRVLLTGIYFCIGNYALHFGIYYYSVAWCCNTIFPKATKRRGRRQEENYSAYTLWNCNDSYSSISWDVSFSYYR